MNAFNRVLAIILWLLLLVATLVAAIWPSATIAWFQRQLEWLAGWLTAVQATSPAQVIVAQFALGIGAIVLFGLLLFAEVTSGRRRGVRIRMPDGGNVELDTDSVGRRLQWHLDQVAEVITVAPFVAARGGAVDIRLEIETGPEVDIPMKTDELVEVTRMVVEQDMGLRLGKLDVRLRCAPFDPEYSR